MSYTNQTVLVSGANRGIGVATVRELLKTDVKKIYAGARRLDSLPDFGDARVVPLQLDITDQASVDAAAKTAADADILLNNAGTAVLANFIDSPIELINGDMDVNYYGTLRIIRAFTPLFTARKSGTIANVISVVGLTSAPGLAGYSASKAALQSLTQTLRATLKGSGIKVLGIYPGPIDTDLAKDIPMEKATPEHAARHIVAGIAAHETYIFPDPVALQIGHLWATDGKTLDTALAGEG
ncbi:SDR family NAD(P)-dependent oxidoreductase [Asticcacaulis benevestitus]|uniref:Short-chain dehydrogenase n=1 Tax=Asticcacaulis benevestitus DSM 16100 = ATCC BAA-896 TaxID=1121022 RepID=V4PKY9_9CAUL|nr:SDR family NAD(P)-dependent oxidoreductase [Asticcacaulis benevestitus]ESQ94627.1 short-chain dehydrogenase [Asticcacaulis benevestitus DSM 16100 = ATCC BAA-896]